MTELSMYRITATFDIYFRSRGSESGMTQIPFGVNPLELLAVTPELMVPFSWYLLSLFLYEGGRCVCVCERAKHIHTDGV